MLKDASPQSFAGIYIVCGYTDLRYGIDSLVAIIERKYHMPLFVPNTLFLFCYNYGLPLYTANRHVEETRQNFGDGSHIIYVNGQYCGDDPLGHLMHDFNCKNPDDMHYKKRTVSATIKRKGRN